MVTQSNGNIAVVNRISSDSSGNIQVSYTLYRDAATMANPPDVFTQPLNKQWNGQLTTDQFKALQTAIETDIGANLT